MRFILNGAFSAWLGLSLSIIGFDFRTWQFWLVLVPTVALVVVINQSGAPPR